MRKKENKMISFVRVPYLFLILYSIGYAIAKMVDRLFRRRIEDRKLVEMNYSS